MKYGLNLRPDGALDALSLGALIHRLDPGIIPFRKAAECQIHVSGGEYNVAANLSDCFGLRTGIATALVDYPIGDLIAERVRAMGVTPFYRRFKHNGVNGPNMATVYSDRGHGVRAPVVFYNRANEAAAQLKPGDFDWAAIFGRGVRWFHSGGIFAALSETTGEVIIEGMKAAKAAGAVTSFDLNYRAKLWNIWGGAEIAQGVIRRIMEHVDVLVGNEEDLQMGLGIPGPEVAAGRGEGASPKLDPHAFFGMIGQVTALYPQVKVIATTLREVHSTNRHSWGRGRVDQRQDLHLAHLRTGRVRPRGRGRRLRGGPLLRPADRRSGAGGGQSGLGTRRAPHHLPRRHDDGDVGAGKGLRRGRLGADSKVKRRLDIGVLGIASWWIGLETQAFSNTQYPKPDSPQTTTKEAKHDPIRHRPHRPGRDGAEPGVEHGRPRLHRGGFQSHDVSDR